MTYKLITHASCKNKRVVSEHKTYDDAYCAKCEQFVPEEWDEIGVDIMKVGEDGELTCEY